MKKDIKICYLHPFKHDAEKLYNQLHIDREKFNLIVYDFDSENVYPPPPQRVVDYVFASEWIYYNPVYYKKFVSLQREGVVNIFVAGECVSPDLNIFDYAIVFDKYLRLDDRIMRKATTDFFTKFVQPQFFERIKDPYKLLREKTDFCNFIYTNAKAHPMRDKLFYKLSEYKKVDSLSKHLKNVDTGCDFVPESIRRKYKFTIASENACYGGYTSEKLILALQAGTIPIYWGDPLVEENFNPKAFINANKMSLDEVLEKVIELDSDDEKYCNMLMEPNMTDLQLEKLKKEEKDFVEFIDNIFSQPLEDAKRVPTGYHPDNYRKFFYNLKTPDLVSTHDVVKVLGMKLKFKSKGVKI